MKDAKRLIPYAVIGVILTIFVSGYLTMNGLQQDMAGQNGKIWAAIDAASGTLTRMYNQMDDVYDNRSSLYAAITDARSGVEAAKAAGDIEGGIAELDAMQSSFNIHVEDNPDFDTLALELGLQDEISQAFRVIEKQREDLIDMQVRYNKLTLIYFWFEPVEVLGEYHDPADTTSIPEG